MKRCLCCLFVLLPFFAIAQKDKTGKAGFCGWQVKDKEKIRAYYQDQFDFLNVQNGDTIVDIGAASGAFEGIFLAATGLDNVSFVLVDINPACLSQEKLVNMLAYYSRVKGDSIRNNFQIVQNTPDSLWLPLNRFRKVWIFNTLHEIPDQQKMVRDICSVLQTGGEVVILEIPSKRKGQLHGGCHKPLLSHNKINELFTSNGFIYKERKEIIRKRNSDLLMVRFVKS